MSKTRPSHPIIRLALVAWLCLGSAPGWGRPLVAQATPIGQAEPAPPAACASIHDEALRDELNRFAQQAIGPTGQPVDVAAAVAAAWQRVEMDQAIDAAVGHGVQTVRQQEDLWSQFLSSWSPQQAERLTQAVAAAAFSAPVFVQAMDRLAEEVAVELSAEIARLSAESASQALLCLQRYIGHRYTEAVAAAFSAELHADAATLGQVMAQEMDTGILAVLDRHRTALGGVGVIVASQLARRVVQEVGEVLARRVAGRVVGRILGKAGSTVIPAVGWAVGAALILYDVMESREGALPQIQEGLQAPAVKIAIRNAVVAELEPQVQRELPQIARNLANELYAQWLEFQRRYRLALTLADENPAFRQVLAETEDLAQLASLVDAMLSYLGTDALNQAIAGGHLPRLLTLPESAYQIWQVQPSVEALLAWADLAGGQMDAVVAHEIYKHKAPTELDRATLLALLALEDPEAIANLVLLKPAHLATLLTIARPHLRTLARQLSPEDLAWLAGYVQRLDPQQTNQLVAQLATRPALMERLQDSRLQEILRRSPDLGSALAFLDGDVTLWALADDLLRLAARSVSLGLFAHKYGPVVTALVVGLPLLLLLALAYRLVIFLLAPLAGLYRLLQRGRQHLSRGEP